VILRVKGLIDTQKFLHIAPLMQVVVAVLVFYSELKTIHKPSRNVIAMLLYTSHDYDIKAF